MITVNIVCIGKLKEQYWVKACEEYSKRMQAFAKFSIKELSEERLGNKYSQAEIESALSKEGTKILSVCHNTEIVPMCIEGKQITSLQLAQWISEKELNGISSISFIIGSSFGLCNEVKSKGKLKLSMSKMTFPHQLARVMLCEQIYRAFQIKNNTKYHK